MNNENNTCIPNTVSLSNKEFQRLSEFVYANFGIKLPPAKKTMLQARLQKRLRELGIKSFQEYSDYLFSPEGRQTELVQFIDKVTTNKTDFFREPAHFDYLVQSALPELINGRGHIRKKIMVWSAGCSTGEEPYTLAMVLSEFAEKNSALGQNFSILATDISTEVLEHAKYATYNEDRVIPVPMLLRKKYLLKSKNRKNKMVRIAPELRRRVEFGQLNFMDNDFGIREPVDIIFCRNVIIYFDKPTQERLLNKFYRYLVSGGYLFLGHSESLQGMEVPLVQVHPTVYRKS